MEAAQTTFRSKGSRVRPRAGTALFVYDKLTPGLDYHAAFVAGRTRPFTPLHAHDYYEAFYCLEGEATHLLNDRASRIVPGDLMLLRPGDCHSIAGKTFELINIAFPADPWRSFCALADLDRTALIDEALSAPAVSVPSAERDSCAAAFVRTLQHFQQPAAGRPPRQQLCWFWSSILEYLLPVEHDRPDPDDRRPAWLVHACRAMHEEENLRQGLARFVELSGVSRAHLTRTLRACIGQAPTEFINELRLRRAAQLLSTTPLEIIEVAMDCGYDNLSYFYRRFRRQYGRSPRTWRLQSQSIVLPLHG